MTDWTRWFSAIYFSPSHKLSLEPFFHLGEWEPIRNSARGCFRSRWNIWGTFHPATLRRVDRVCSAAPVSEQWLHFIASLNHVFSLAGSSDWSIATYRATELQRLQTLSVRQNPGDWDSCVLASLFYLFFFGFLFNIMSWNLKLRTDTKFPFDGT